MKWAVVALFAACGHSHSSTSTPSSSPPEETGSRLDSHEEQPDLENDPVDLPKEKPVPAEAPTATSTGGAVAQQWVAAHNKVRAAHCAAPLTWSSELASIAQKWADTLKAKGCVFGHSGGDKYGENLAGGTSGALGPQGSVEMWAEEEKLYKFPNGGFSMQTGHFTQVVWTDTRKVGCGQVTCNGMDLYVCNYDPPGNWDGQYREHVLPTSCKK